MLSQYGLMAFLKAFKKSEPQFKNEEFFHDYAVAGYSHCCDWLGKPPDPEWTFKLIPWHRSMCARDSLNHRYLLMICDSDGSEAICRRIGHEMYHRVTWRRSGLRSQLWTNEMLACAVSDHIMNLHGMENYVHAAEQVCVSSNKLDTVRLRNIHSPRRLGEITRTSTSYPQDFGRDLIRLANALMALCGWESFVALGTKPTLADWMCEMSPQLQHAVNAVLGFEEPKMELISADLEAQFLHYKTFGRALYWIGEFHYAVEGLQIARDRRPSDAETHLYLANALWYANRRQEAMHTLRRGLKIVPSSQEMQHTLNDYARGDGDI